MPGKPIDPLERSVKRQPGEISCRSTRSSWLSARLNDPDSWGSSASTVVMLKSPRNSPTTRLRRRARDGATFAEWLLPTPGCIGWLSISRPLISAGSRPSGEREPASRIPSTPGSRPGRRDRRSQGRYLPSKAAANSTCPALLPRSIRRRDGPVDGVRRRHRQVTHTQSNCVIATTSDSWTTEGDDRCHLIFAACFETLRHSQRDPSISSRL